MSFGKRGERAPLGPAPRRLIRCLAIGSALLGLCAPAVAQADAPDPVPSATNGSVVYNADGSRTVSVSGLWAWTTHHSDCNRDGRSVGYAVDWDDPAQPGNLVTTIAGVPVDVGSASSNVYNPFDNLVHPTPPTSAAQDVFNRTLWRGGCGTYDPSLGYNTGSWGPISHTYDASYSGDVRLCVLMYDVHGDKKGQPNSNDQITAGAAHHNNDNSAQDNAKTPLGNGCFKVTVGSVVVTDPVNIF